MTMEEATELFNRRVPGQNPSLVERLIQELRWEDIAIEQAAAVIHLGRLSIEEYLGAFEKSQSEPLHLPRRPHDDLFRFDNQVIIQAFQVTLDTIYGSTPWAIDILAFMAFLDHEHIPLSLLADYACLWQKQQRANSDNVQVNDDNFQEKYDNVQVNEDIVKADISQAFANLHDGLDQLEAYHLITPGTGTGYSYSMTTLAQISVRSWLLSNSLYQARADCSVQTLEMAWKDEEAPESEKGASESDEGAPESRSNDQLLPHVAAMADCQPVQRYQKKVPWDDFLGQAGDYALKKERFVIAHQILEASAIAYKDMLDFEEDPAALPQRLTYFKALHHVGRFGEAQIVGEDLRDRMERKLGPTDPNTLYCKWYLGALYANQDKLGKAEEILSTTYRDARLRLDEKRHDELLLLLNELAVVYSNQGRLDKALALHLEVFEALVRKHGAGHAKTFDVMTDIGQIYFKQHRRDKAKGWMEDLLKKAKDVYGDLNLEMAHMKYTLADIYWEMGMFKEAESACKEVFELFEKLKGATHSDTISIRAKLGLVYRDTGRYEEYGDLFRELLALTEQTPDLSWSTRLTVLENYANSMRLNGALDQAIEIMKQVLDSSKQHLGLYNEKTASTMCNLSELYAERNDFKEAGPLAEEGYQISRASMSLKTPTLLHRWFQARYFQQKNGTWAAPWEYDIMLQAHIATYGELHPLTSETMYCLAMAYWSKDERTAAVAWMKRCAETQHEIQHAGGEEFKAEEALRQMRYSLNSPNGDILSWT